MQQQQQSSAVVIGAPQPAAVPYIATQQYIRPPVTHFLNRQAIALGVLQIVIGVLCIVFNATDLGIYECFSFVAHGIWGGLIVSKEKYGLAV